MTEAERIMQKGFLKEDFLKEEVICDFLVDEKRKKIWAIELDLLREFGRVCEKYNLKYFLVHGSLLGAIRHNGIIPWDDDIDVGMFREDYERFIEVAKDEFSEPYFLQTPYTDKGYFFSFIRLRNSNTTAISRAFQYESFNQGIYLDIFPFDYTEKEEMEERYNQIKKLTIQNSKYMKLKNPEFSISETEKAQILSTNPLETYEMIQKLAMNHYKEPKDYLAFAVWTNLEWPIYLYETKDHEELIEHEFEGMKIPVPVGYDKILRIIYGDYMKFPSIEKRGTWHQGAFFDPDAPYTEYIQ